MNASKAIKGVNPMEALAYLAHELDGVRAAIGMSMDDEIGLISLETLAEKHGLTLNVVTRAISRAGQPTVEFGNRRFIRKPVWLAVLRHMEERSTEHYH